MNEIFYWACDQSTKSGEGKLAKLFIANLKKNYKVKKIKSKVVRTNMLSSSNFFYTKTHKYLVPLYGIINLWIIYFKKKNICYINYLPLWNFLVFLFLPPKCILGPITGTIDKKKNFLFKKFFEFLSLLIIKIRYDNIFFSNNFYQKKFDKASHNFMISNFNTKKFIIKNKNKKKYDFVFYIRNESLKKNLYIKQIINKLIYANYKIAVIGGRFDSKKVKNFGQCSDKKAKKIISLSSCSIANRENLFSFFVQDCLLYKLTVFYNSQFKKYQIFNIDNFYPIDMDNVDISLTQIFKKLKKV